MSDEQNNPLSRDHSAQDSQAREMVQELVDEARGLVATHSYRPASFLVVFRIIRSCLPSGLDMRFILLSISIGFLSGKIR